MYSEKCFEEKLSKSKKEREECGDYAADHEVRDTEHV